MKEILLSDLDYVTQKNVAILKKNKIFTAWDLLTSYPSKFDDYTLVSVKNAKLEENITIAGVVQGKSTVYNARSKLSILNFYIESEGHKIRVTIFNRQYLRNKLNYGVYVRLTGKFKNNFTNFTASEIHMDEICNDISPVFNIKGIKDEVIFEIKQKLLEENKDKINDYLPKELKDKYKLIDLYDAISYINTPDNIDETSEAEKRIKFDELFLYQLKIKYLLYMRKNFPEGQKIVYNKEKVESFISRLPYLLTSDQNKVIEEILADLSSNYKMNRLLQGEVGSGKTVVAAISLYAAYTAGFQGVIMAPTEVLAIQHYKTFTNIFKDINLNIILLTSTNSSKEKEEILTGLCDGSIDIAIGTHSLFQKDVFFHNLGLVVTDEEHRFGVKQRVEMVSKGKLIDHLKMSATPIPRSLAISVLGESDISIIKTMPGNKKDVITKFVNYKDNKMVIEHMKAQIARGKQIFVICPMINESDVMDLNNATKIYDNMQKYFLGICNVGLIHSKLKPIEKETVMNKFTENEIQILVSTSVIEVGVNIINATTIVILDADRFGIAQLHQMRGRVRRSDDQAYCFLVSDTETDSAINRLKLIESSSDGFELAEADLLIRGPGDFFGEKQTGLVTFKLSDIIADKELLELCNNAAEEVIEKELLFNEKYKEIYEIVHKNYLENKEMLD